MISCFRGDIVLCKSLYGEIVSNDTLDYDELVKLKIASYYGDKYIVFSPDDVYLKDYLYVRKDNYKKYNMQEKHIGLEILIIRDDQIFKLHHKFEGMCCIKCGDYSQYAEANKDKDFQCYLCRENPYR